MSSVNRKLLAAASAAMLIASPAIAADMPPPVVYQPAPMVPVKEFDGWYLRGDIGMTNQKVKSLDNALFASTAGLAFIDPPAFDSGMTVGLGFGHHFNDWLRFDLTGEYRGKTRFTALDTYNGPQVNDYTASKSEWLFLANAYVDLGTWWCITPFVGAGIGLASITISNFRDISHLNDGGGYAHDDTKMNFAWALHAGLAYNVSKSFAVEFGYRYLSLGDAQSGDIINLNGSNTVNNPMIFNDITSHDFRLGLRWTCCDEPSMRRQPVAMQPAYVAAPQPALGVPPAYAQPQYVAPPPPAPVYTQPQYAPPPPPVYQQPQYAPAYPQPPLSRRG